MQIYYKNPEKAKNWRSVKHSYHYQCWNT